MARKIRVSNIRSFTSLPYRLLAEKSFIDYREASPTENARMLSEGEVDLALVPVTEFAIHGGYVGLDFGLAGRSRIDSVFLLGQRPLSELKSICLDVNSYSSVCLLRLLLMERMTYQPQLVRVRHESLLEQVNSNVGALVTGDLALNARGKYSLEFDLAEEWFRLTKKPFVFSVWAARPEILTRGLDTRLNALFHKAIKARESMAVEHHQGLEISKLEASKHLTQTVIYHLDNECKAGMAEFFSRAYERNLLPSEPYRSASYKVIEGVPAPILPPRSLSRILEDSLAGKRLSIAEAGRLVEEASLQDLALAADMVRSNLAEVRSVEFVLQLSNAEAMSETLLKKRIQSVSKRGYSPRLIKVKSRPPQNWEELLALENLVNSIRHISNASLDIISVPELIWLSSVTGRPVREITSRLISAGLNYLSPVGGDFLIDRRMREEGMDLYDASEWLSVIKWFHRFGGQSDASMRLRRDDTWGERLLHLQKLRTLQDETPGFRGLILTQSDNPQARLDFESEAKARMIARLFMDNVTHIRDTLPAGDSIKTALKLSSGLDAMSVDLSEGEGSQAEGAAAFLESLRVIGMDIESVTLSAPPKPVFH